MTHRFGERVGVRVGESVTVKNGGDCLCESRQYDMCRSPAGWETSGTLSEETPPPQHTDTPPEHIYPRNQSQRDNAITSNETERWTRSEFGQGTEQVID